MNFGGYWSHGHQQTLANAGPHTQTGMLSAPWPRPLKTTWPQRGTDPQTSKWPPLAAAQNQGIPCPGWRLGSWTSTQTPIVVEQWPRHSPRQQPGPGYHPSSGKQDTNISPLLTVFAFSYLFLTTTHKCFLLFFTFLHQILLLIMALTAQHYKATDRPVGAFSLSGPWGPRLPPWVSFSYLRHLASGEPVDSSCRPDRAAPWVSFACLRCIKI